MVGEKSIGFNGQSLWVQSGNLDATGPVTLLIHGNSVPGSAAFKDVVEQMEQQGTPYVVFDLPGHGKSSHYDDYSANTMVDAIHVVIEQMGLDKREGGYDAVAWSYGGHLAIQALGQEKLPNVNSLTLTGTPPLDMKQREGLGSPFNAEHSAMKESLNLTSDLSGEQYERLAQAYYCKDGDAGCAAPKELEQAIRETDPNIRSAILESLGAGEFKDEIDILNNRGDLKLNIIISEKDPLVNHEYLKGVKDLLNEDTWIVVPDEGHSFPFEKPQSFIKELNQVLSPDAELSPPNDMGTPQGDISVKR